MIFLCYLVIFVKEDKEKLWFVIDDLNNLIVYEIFFFIVYKEIEFILIFIEELKYLLNEFLFKKDIIYEIMEIIYLENN